jgi:lysophospholipase L1-like esterase
MADMNYVSLNRLSHFLNKLTLKFAPISHTHTKNEIEDLTLDAAVLYTPQNLTEEQKAQARENLGITENSSGGDNVITPPVGETVTTEYVYTYDGDTNSEEHGWITNYGGIKVFARMGDVPKGDLNLVGATIFRTNPNNIWLDRTFTITEEHLTKTLTKSGELIPAVQEGLIQIYDIMASDFSEFTVLCICTKPGWYNVCFDDWFEIINFPETGIYAYDKRTYGGNDYAKTFTFTVTTTVSSSGGNSSIGGIDTTLPTQYTGNEISMFSRGICIGDSVTEGSFDGNGGVVVKRFSYPAILERITGVDIANAGIAGMTSQTWYEATQDSTPHWGKWVNQEWVWNMDPPNSGNDIISSTLDYSNFDFAIIHLGINDLAPVYDNSKTIEEVLANFETYINLIINSLKNANSGIKIFLATIVPSYAPATNPTYKQLNDKIKEIVEATEDAYLMDINTYSVLASKPEYNVTHPTALGYHKLANEIASYISYIISCNLDEFKEVQFIQYTD